MSITKIETRVTAREAIVKFWRGPHYWQMREYKMTRASFIRLLRAQLAIES